jgi:outer membrane lipoprotein-sorting protein
MKLLYLVLAGAVLLAAPAGAQTPSVDDLLAKNLASRGGAEKLKNINTRKVTGTISAQGMQMAMTVTSKRPNSMLQEMRIGDRRIVTAFDGEQAWTINPMMGETPQAVHGVQESLLRDQSYFDGPLELARSRGDKMEVLGKEDVDGTPTWKLAITHEGRQTTINLDADTALERKVSTAVSDGGVETAIESLISDYQPADGIMVPRKVTTRIGGQQQATVAIESVEFNVPVDDSIFKMQAPQGK